MASGAWPIDGLCDLIRVEVRGWVSRKHTDAQGSTVDQVLHVTHDLGIAVMGIDSHGTHSTFVILVDCCGLR